MNNKAMQLFCAWCGIGTLVICGLGFWPAGFLPGGIEPGMTPDQVAEMYRNNALGIRIAGGRWHGGWEGLAPGQLNEGRDLPVLNDYRAVLSIVLRGTQGVGDAQLAALFPGNPFAGAALMTGNR